MSFVLGLPTDNGIKNRTCNGKCSGCASCCTEFLPWTKKEVIVVYNYLKKHPEINCQYHSSKNKDNLFAICPFNDEQTHRCLIYDVRPGICHVFMCNQPFNVIDKNRRKYSIGKAFFNKCEDNFSHDIRNMISTHALFFGDYGFDFAYRKILFAQQGISYEHIKAVTLMPMVVDHLFSGNEIKQLDLNADYLYEKGGK